MKSTRILSLALVAILTFSSIASVSAAYEEITCPADGVFSQNSCDQCFTGGEKGEGDHLGFLVDEWINLNDNAQLLYKEAQVLPEMINLASENVSWIQTPDSQDFWEYPEEFNALYDSDAEGYVLPGGESVTWIQSKLAYAYKLEKNSAPQGSDIGLLVYPISVLDLDADGNILDDDLQEHRECVLFTSGEAGEEEVVTATQRLPETGPAEYILLMIVAMILGFGFLQLKQRS